MQSAFQTRVARRVLLLFVLSALVPVGALTVVSYRQVTDQLENQGRDRLRQAGKSTGMAIVQRLLLLQAELKRNAVSVAAARSNAVEAAARSGGYARIFDRMWIDRERGAPVPIVGVPATPPALRDAERQRLANGQTILRAVTDGSTRQILLAVAARTGSGRGVTIWAEANPGFLWGGGDLQSATPPGTDLCVLDAEAGPLFCSFPVGPETAERLRAATPHRDVLTWESDGRALLVASWPIFLQFEFGHADWTVLLAEARASILAPAADFRRAFPAIVLLALLVVIFLSQSQIRRVLGPLQRLTAATRLVANHDFDRAVSVETGDEFEDLADSFNTMAQQLGRQFRTLSAINDIDQAALSRATPDQLAEVVLERVPGAAGADLVGLVLATTAADGFATWRVSGRRLPSRRFTCSTPVDPDDEAKMQQMSDRQVDPDHAAAPSFLAAFPPGMREGLHLVVHTLAFETAPAGALVIGFEKDAKTEEACEIAHQVADQISVALGNARLVERLEQLSWGTLQALARSIDAMSSWTAGHSERVRDLALALGRELELDEHELDCLHRGALLHDIGKLGVPSSILDKHGKLTEDEFDRVCRHVHIGARILAPIPSYVDVIPIVLHHHEHYDGTGYPDGLSGNGIPFLARVVAVADCYDALSSERPYRTGSPVQALSIIRRETGTSFDPRVAAALMRIMENDELAVAG